MGDRWLTTASVTAEQYLDELQAILKQRCSAEGNWILNRRQRAGYTAKAFICRLLRMQDGHTPKAFLYRRLGRLAPRDDREREAIDVAYLSGGSYSPPGEPTTHWADVLQVGRGVRHGWWYDVTYVSD